MYECLARFNATVTVGGLISVPGVVRGLSIFSRVYAHLVNCMRIYGGVSSVVIYRMV